eukprot:CAMPEP_0174375998 /NCGR_PEP_ID=MMETSP0811_2-20130205/116627_1 /TAXON_ID=73025 ORGANISM="Eutreptiella gymnastica-like, Strain CCMP1594" /NCGR_SAMPLE_ID=MMETSP0811_2 /ASSEMBLY_ACC=CAM_ASM_000667 /LENGTH=39 /DNA_ID= /DNA_START= /DNA_END= /DNA_ORIENTATION=
MKNMPIAIPVTGRTEYFVLCAFGSPLFTSQWGVVLNQQV